MDLAAPGDDREQPRGSVIERCRHQPVERDELAAPRMRVDAAGLHLQARVAQQVREEQWRPGVQMVVWIFGNRMPLASPIVDRTRERLGTSDTAIIAMRRLLLQEIRELAQGHEPFAAQHGDVYWVRSASLLLKRDVEFEEGARDLMKAEV